MSGVSRVAFRSSIEGSVASAMRAIAGGCTTIGNKAVPVEVVSLATELNNHLIAASINVPDFWCTWADEVVIGTPTDQAIVDAVGTAAGTFLQADSTTPGVGRKMKDFWSEVAVLLPKIDQQLPLRIGPIRSQWDTYGPGMLKHIERQIWKSSPPSDWWPTSITARMIHPVRGGGGDLCVDGESFWMEAMLTNDNPLIPEVLRAIWLSTRVAIESHLRSRSGVMGLRKGWAWASVAFVLAAAAEVGVTDGRIAVADAMRQWQFGDADVASRVQVWWDQRDDSVPMPLLVRGLEA